MSGLGLWRLQCNSGLFEVTWPWDTSQESLWRSWIWIADPDGGESAHEGVAALRPQYQTRKQEPLQPGAHRTFKPQQLSVHPHAVLTGGHVVGVVVSIGFLGPTLQDVKLGFGGLGSGLRATAVRCLFFARTVSVPLAAFDRTFFRELQTLNSCSQAYQHGFLYPMTPKKDPL